MAALRTCKCAELMVENCRNQLETRDAMYTSCDCFFLIATTLECIIARELVGSTCSKQQEPEGSRGHAGILKASDAKESIPKGRL